MVYWTECTDLYGLNANFKRDGGRDSEKVVSRREDIRGILAVVRVSLKR